MKFTSQIISGQGRGKALGYPTLNLIIPSNFPYKTGIYAGCVQVFDQSYLGAFHFGPIPTFKQTKPSLEVYILDGSFPTTPSLLSFELLHYLRPIRSFSEPAKLIRQITIDVARCRRLLGIT